MKRDRAVIYKDFYTNKFSAVKAVIVVYLDTAFEDFFNQYPFNSKNFKDYDHDKMLKHIVLIFVVSWVMLVLGYMNY